MRILFYLVLALILVTFLRIAIGVITKGLGGMLESDQSRAGGRPAPPEDMPSGGELKRDPVCGTFVAAATSVKKTVGGQTVHFCSTACRDAYSG